MLGVDLGWWGWDPSGLQTPEGHRGGSSLTWVNHLPDLETLALLLCRPSLSPPWKGPAEELPCCSWWTPYVQRPTGMWGSTGGWRYLPWSATWKVRWEEKPILPCPAELSWHTCVCRGSIFAKSCWRMTSPLGWCPTKPAPPHLPPGLSLESPDSSPKKEEENKTKKAFWGGIYKLFIYCIYGLHLLVYIFFILSADAINIKTNKTSS